MPGKLESKPGSPVCPVGPPEALMPESGFKGLPPVIDAARIGAKSGFCASVCCCAPKASARLNCCFKIRIKLLEYDFNIVVLNHSDGIPKFNYTCCIEDCPAWMAAKAPVNPGVFAAGDNESKGFVPMMGGHLETLVSPTPLLNKAFRPKLLLGSLVGKNGILEIALFEVVGGMLGAFDLCE